MIDFTDGAQHDRDRFRAHHAESEDDRHEAAAQATKMLIADADDTVRSCNDILTDGLEKIGRKLPTEKAVAGIYRAYCAIAAIGGQAQFLAERGIKVHGGTKNDCYPIFSAFTKGSHPWLRDRVCKYAEVAALAIHQNVQPEAFPDWLKRHPIEKACAEYRSIMREPGKSKHNDEQERVSEFLVDPKKEPDKAPIIPATPVTPGYVGLKLAVLDFSNDGSGNFRVLGIMPHEVGAVMRMVMTAASKVTINHE
jgi:hypothetical protein